MLDYGKMQQDTEVHLKRLGMQISSRTSLATLSLAQQQMVEIAKALSLHARILIMDEPTSSLTLSETARLLDVVKQLRSEGVSIIYVSHRLSEITEIADRVTVLRDGANAGGLSKSEITRERMVKMMIGRDLEDFYVQPESTPRPGFFEVKGLRTARFPKREVSFSVGQGEILGMAGLVGAGRTEVAQAICGIDKPQAGSMTIDQKPIQIQSPKDAVANGIYLVPDDRRRFGLVIDMSVLENMTLPALSRYSSQGIINSKAEHKAAEEGVKKLNVKTHSVDARVGNLSGGNQQKVILAKWLALNPKVLILDEPTRGIDVGAKAEIYSLLRALAKERRGDYRHQQRYGRSFRNQRSRCGDARRLADWNFATARFERRSDYEAGGQLAAAIYFTHAKRTGNFHTAGVVMRGRGCDQPAFFGCLEPAKHLAADRHVWDFEHRRWRGHHHQRN